MYLDPKPELKRSSFHLATRSLFPGHHSHHVRPQCLSSSPAVEACKPPTTTLYIKPTQRLIDLYFGHLSANGHVCRAHGGMQPRVPRAADPTHFCTEASAPLRWVADTTTFLKPHPLPARPSHRQRNRRTTPMRRIRANPSMQSSKGASRGSSACS